MMEEREQRAFTKQGFAFLFKKESSLQGNSFILHRPELCHPLAARELGKGTILTGHITILNKVKSQQEGRREWGLDIDRQLIAYSISTI